MNNDIDINEFINDAQDDVPSADFIATPEGEYPMYVKPGSTKIVQGESDKGKWAMYTATAVVDDQAAREATNMENPTAKVRFFLDVNDSGALVKGTNRNVTLGKLLKATGQDRPGWSYAGIEGVNFRGKVKHIADKKDATRIAAEVVAFAKL